ncbi:MAG TPA: hypothetical protein VI039_09760 [Solirubrobacterales bacterium]
MDMDRLSTGEKIAGGSAVLLFIFMFFDWFKVEVSGGEGFLSVSAGGNAWEWFTWIDLFLLLTVIVALAVVIVRLSDALLEPSFSLNSVVAILGAVAVLLVLYRIIDPPSSGELSGVGVDVSRQLGVFLGLIATAGVTYGGYRAMQEEGSSFGEIGDQLSNRGSGGEPPQPPSSTPPAPPPPPPSN